MLVARRLPWRVGRVGERADVVHLHLARYWQIGAAAKPCDELLVRIVTRIGWRSVSVADLRRRAIREPVKRLPAVAFDARLEAGT